MATASSTQVLAAARQWLKPLVHVLIRCGIPWRDFAELARAAYVEVAIQQFGKRGRPTNVSRTAVLTGLARREVRKQRERLDVTPQPWTGYVTKGSLVLSAWHQDPEFLDSEGKPALLPVDGEGPTFTALLRLCGASDVRATTLLKELRAVGAIQETPDGRLQALKRIYIPQMMDEQLIRLWGTVIADVASAYVHNLTRRADLAPRFERAAVHAGIAATALPEFRRFLNQEGEAFLERVDAWLTGHEARPNETELDSTSMPIRLGVGVYQIEDCGAPRENNHGHLPESVT
jgi:Family of unknown function (DUF6502)